MVSRYQLISRMLAFLAMATVISSVSWATRDYTLIPIGVLGLGAGHLYSWRRREASILRSLILLLFMVLTVFLGGDILLSGLGDRLLLSRYLIYGLVLGSFDLMRKRNVLASLILGALLLVLVSELALDMWFIVFVALFTVLALASEAFGRVESGSMQAVVVGQIRWPEATKAGMLLSAALVAAAAVLFLLMPRLASNQVTQASWLPSRLDLSLGGLLGLPSRPGVSPDPGILASEPAGEDAVGASRAELGYSGPAADRAVMNVRSPISSYWRGMVLSQYDGKGWLSSSSQIELRDHGGGEFTLPDSRSVLTGERIYWQVYYLLADQPNAVFTGYNPGRLYLPEREDVFLSRGTLYRSLSALPQVRPEALRADSIVVNDLVNLRLPEIPERTSALARSIVEGAQTDYDKAARLERFLASNYPYQLDVEPLPPGRDAVDYFLFEQQAGYCAHFATAMAVMAREVGLPARVAAGYLPGYIDPLTGAHIVRAGDAHAWVEIHFQRRGWVAFDPTPRADAAMGFIGKRSWLRFGIEDFAGAGSGSVLRSVGSVLSAGRLPAAVWLIPLTIIVTAAVAFFAAKSVRRRLKSLSELPRYSLLDGEERRSVLILYRKMLVLLMRKGIPRRLPSQPPEEYADKISELLPAGREFVQRLTRLAGRAAYDPAPFESPDMPEIRQGLRSLRKELS